MLRCFGGSGRRRWGSRWPQAANPTSNPASMIHAGAFISIGRCSTMPPPCPEHTTTFPKTRQGRMCASGRRARTGARTARLRLAHALGPGRRRLADTRERLDRARVVLARPFADARLLADCAVTRVAAGLEADARAFRHGTLALVAGKLAVAAPLGNGAHILLTGCRTMTGTSAHRPRVVQAGGEALTAVSGDIAFVPFARNVAMAGALADVPPIVVACLGLNSLSMAAVPGNVAGILRTSLESQARANPNAAGVPRTGLMADAPRRRGTSSWGSGDKQESAENEQRNHHDAGGTRHAGPPFARPGAPRRSWWSTLAPGGGSR